MQCKNFKRRLDMKVNFGKLLFNQVQQLGDKTALVNIERNRSYTFKELHSITNKVCNMMKNQFDMGFGDVYVNLLENDNNSLLSHWLWKGAATGAWLNYRDSVDEHIYQIDYVNPKIVFVENAVLEKENYYEAFLERNIAIIVMDKPEKEMPGVHYLWDLLRNESDTETNVEYDKDQHIVLYRFTGGTTGRGKCAIYTLRNKLGAMQQAYAYPEELFDENSKFLHVTPLSHASSLIVLPIYFKGGTNYTINIPDLELLCKTVQENELTSTFVVPTILYRLLELGLESKYDLSSLNSVFYGASPMSPSKLEDLQGKFGNIFIQGYGSTEAWPFIMVLGRKDHIIETDEDRKRLNSAGRPLPGVELSIMDEEGKEMPFGEIGEIWIRSDSVIQGYYRAPEETASGFSEGGHWKSGDLGYMDNAGYVYIVDRKKDMIITGGFNVYAVEVENVINSHPAVYQSVVVGIPHEQWGETVVAEVVLKEGRTVTDVELNEYMKGKIGTYKIPKTINFVDELPVTSVGKVLRRFVRDKYWKETARNVH
jgi:fatty-acyl-CoA synthase